MDCYGFTGKLLKIDLSSKSVSEENLNREYSKLFLGGAGYACRYLIDLIDEKTVPLSPQNVVVVMNGPFSGTTAPSTGRFVICTKSPYSGIWGESNCGGFFGPELKKAGWDGLIISRKSDSPTYIKIINDKVEFKDASHLWGKGIKETERILRSNFGEKNPRMISIGQGGENLVKFANIGSEGRSAGRIGIGAVFGSKNLKGIIVKGNTWKPNLANPTGFKEATKKAIKYILNSKYTQVFRECGTSAGVWSAHLNGDLPIKYFSQGDWRKEVIDITGMTLRENYLINNKSCYNCVVGCGRIVKIEDEEYHLPHSEGPEYETIVGFGSLILNNDLKSISIANHLCNDFGIDTISSSGAIALLYNLYNRGTIKKEDVNDLELDWGNSKSMIALVKKIALREGIGEILAEGSNAVGEKFKISGDEIATVNKVEVPYHDIRACYGLSLTYGFSPRGACHMTGDCYKALREGNEVDYSSLGITKMDMYLNSIEMARNAALVQDYRALYSSLIMCNFVNPPPPYIAELLSTMLGVSLDMDDIKLLGERIFTLKRLFNIKMGLTAKNDYVPKILTTPVPDGASAGKAPDFDKLKEHFYEFRNWDPKSGAPNDKKIKELSLGNIKI